MRPDWRAACSATCLVLAVVLVPLSVTGWWLRSTLTETDDFVATVAPLAEEPAVRSAVADLLTERIMEGLDGVDPLPRAAEALEARGVPPELARVLSLLAEPLRERLDERVSRAAHSLVASEAFADSWASANEVAHTELVAVLEDDSDLVELGADQTVSVPVSTLLETLRARLVEGGVPGADRIEVADASFAIGSVEQLEKAQTGYDVLRRWGLLLPWACAGLLLAGVALARDRRRAVIRFAGGSLAVLLLLVLGLSVGREQVLGGLPPGASAAGEAVLEVVAARLRTVARLGIVVMALVVGTALVTGSGTRARRLRSAVADTWRRCWAAVTGHSLSGWIGVGVAASALLAVLVLPDPGPLLLAVLVVVGGVGATVARAAPWSR
ncbi:hypothetical protein KUV85_03865 [Nocardioides panacisoli]|uniref:hypothetical protein n=1 Tax=Nocardioides panacisoli TaxID=627624 RepID=UPI001C629DEA|nr:hypothetical protein [Nocardioides panacisoli]QYJ04830.1 hypothetical protein KUV85_03865 [Nocardioides panacisoli]